MSTIDQANGHLKSAFELLKRDGMAERFFPLAVDVGQKQWGQFFGQFGSETGFFLHFEESAVPCEITVTFGIRRYRQSLWNRLQEAFQEIKAILRGKDSTFKIHLADEQVTKLKDLIRNL